MNVAANIGVANIGSAHATTGVGRFNVLSYNQLIAPGKCAGCGGFRANDHYIDFGLELDFYGVVYLCLEVCFVEVANQIGFLSPEQAKSLKEQIHNTVGANESLLMQLERLGAVRDAIDGYRSVDPRSALDRGDSGTVRQSSSDSGTGTEGQSDPAAAGGQSNPDGKQSGSPESPDESGSAHVRNDDSVDEFAKQFGI